MLRIFLLHIAVFFRLLQKPMAGELELRLMRAEVSLLISVSIDLPVQLSVSWEAGKISLC